MFFGKIVIVLAEGRCNVYDTGAFIGQDKIGFVDLKRLVAIRKPHSCAARIGVILKQLLIELPCKVPPLYAAPRARRFRGASTALSSRQRETYWSRKEV